MVARLAQIQLHRVSHHLAQCYSCHDARGLGGPLKLTARGDQIKACVHGEGTTLDERGQPIRDGYVETELVDGNGPGRNVTIRLDFAEVSFNGPLCCVSFLAQDLLKSSMQNKLPQLWCGLPPQAIDWDLGLGVSGTPTHPAVNERGNLLCAHIE